MNTKSLFSVSRRAFSQNYGCPNNSKVFLQVSAGEKNLGKMVFQLYDNHNPQTTTNFKAFCASDHGFTGTHFHRGTVGLGVEGGKIGEENVGAFGVRNTDENLTLRHFKRGLLTSVTNGSNSNGSEFMVTFGEAPWLDGYQTVFGELVEGESTLQAIEGHCNRHGKLSEEIKITAAGEL